MTKFLTSVFLIVVFCLCVWPKPPGPEQAWLQAAQRVVADGDMDVSTTNSAYAHLFIDWALSHGYIVSVSHVDPAHTNLVAGMNTNMIFIVVAPAPKAK